MTIDQSRYTMKLLGKVARGTGLSREYSLTGQQDYDPLKEVYDTFSEILELPDNMQNIDTLSTDDPLNNEIIDTEKDTDQDLTPSSQTIKEDTAGKNLNTIFQNDLKPESLVSGSFSEKNIILKKKPDSSPPSSTGKNNPEESVAGDNYLETSQQDTRETDTFSSDLNPERTPSNKNDLYLFEAADFKNHKEKADPSTLKPLFLSSLKEKSPASKNNEHESIRNPEETYSTDKIIERHEKEPDKGAGLSLQQISETVETITYSRGEMPSGLTDIKKNKVNAANETQNDPDTADSRTREEREKRSTTSVDDLFQHANNQRYPSSLSEGFNKELKAVQDKSPIKNKSNAESNSGKVKIGNINISIKGKQKTENEEWPEAPQYKNHVITEDWEWSCHYCR